MSKISIRESHNLSQDAAKDKVSVFEDMVSKYGVKVVWSGYNADIKGMGIGGNIVVTSSDVTVNIKLGMMAKAAGVKAEKLEPSIRKRLVNALTETES